METREIFMSRKGFAPIFVILIVVVAIAAAVIAGIVVKNTTKNRQAVEQAAAPAEQSATVSSTPAAASSTIEVVGSSTGSTSSQQASSGQASVDTSTWQTYRNEEYGFEVKYPSNYVAEEISDVVHEFDLLVYPHGNYGEGEEIPGLNVFIDSQPLKLIKNVGKTYSDIEDFVKNEPSWFKTPAQLVDFNGIKAAQSLTGQNNRYVQYNFINGQLFFSVYVDQFVDTAEIENIARTFEFIK